MNAKAISEKKSTSGCFRAVFGLIFFAAGMAFLWFIFLSPLIESLGAQDWPQADCRILKSEIKVKRDSDGDTYKPLVEYQYIVAGRKYHGDRPTFEDVSASRKWAKRISDKYPVGSTSQCFYDPQEPGNSVLDRDYEISFYLMQPEIISAAQIAFAKNNGNIRNALRELYDQFAAGGFNKILS